MSPATQDRGSRLLAWSRQEEPGPVAGPGLACPSCLRALLVSTFRKSFLLICRCGNQISPHDPTGSHSAEFSEGLEALLRAWEKRLHSLQSLSHDARSNGFPSFSDVMDRHARNLQARIERLRRFSKPPSARLVTGEPG